jgi:phosphatidate phosphatase PAH1
LAPKKLLTPSKMSCVDIIVVRQRDDSLRSSPFFIRFNNRNPNGTTAVTIYVDDKPLQSLQLEQEESTEDSCVLVIENKQRYTRFMNYKEYISHSTVNTASVAKEKKDASAVALNSTTTTTTNTTNTTATVASSSSSAGMWSSLTDRWLQSIQKETYDYSLISPNSTFLKRLNLSQEITPIHFQVNKETIAGRIFLWNHDDKVVISDVDGTITRSDVLGHILPKMGFDYAHAGVASLLSSIHNNGYRIMYLTARPIGQFSTTRSYLEGIKQSDSTLPIGPIITAPNGTFSSFAREVIIKRPEMFKISILQFIKSIFTGNPFDSGFGNRPTDDESYSAAGIDKSKIFRLNKEGKITIEKDQIEFSSYSQLEMHMNQYFPRIVPNVPFENNETKENGNASTADQTISLDSSES